MIRRNPNKKSKSLLIHALASKNKERIREALNIDKPLKVLFFSKVGELIFLESDKNKQAISASQKEEIIKQEEKKFKLIIFEEEKTYLNESK